VVCNIDKLMIDGNFDLCTYNDHNQKVHEGVEFCCDICGKDFALKKVLRRHISTFHKGLVLIVMKIFTKIFN
jgi:hypothetical protein